jgi:hypothetical protein
MYGCENAPHAVSPDEVDGWRHGGRDFNVVLASTPDTMDLELDDVAPALEGDSFCSRPAMTTRT